MDSTGGSTQKSDKRENSIPKDHWKFIPSIKEQGLEEKHSRKKL